MKVKCRFLAAAIEAVMSLAFGALNLPAPARAASPIIGTARMALRMSGRIAAAVTLPGVPI